MGADIHVQMFHKLEDGSYEEMKLYKIGKGGLVKNVTHFAPYNSRNYELFGILAGVRSNDNPIIPLRGMWDDMPQEAKNYHYNSSYSTWTFNHTWFDWCELEAFALSNSVVSKWVEQLRFMIDCYEIYYPTPGEVIICIAFDN